MFGLFTRAQRKPQATRQRRTQLCLEQLETRYCPAAPVMGFLMGTPQAGHNAWVSGSVSDEHPSSVVVTLSGILSATVQADFSGHFSLTAAVCGAGTVYATAVDEEGLSSNTASTTISPSAPSISLALTYGAQRQVTLSGHISDIDLGGQTVTFSGAVSGSVVTASDGSFSLTVTASQLGTVYASLQDSWGLTASAQVSLSNHKAYVTSFRVIEGQDNRFTFEGTVSDEFAAGLVVTFSGLDALAGTSAVVQSDGTFTVSIEVPTNQNGNVSAQVTDWWGLDSDLMWEVLDHQN